MNAIILAAGKGTRLRPYTQEVPKPLLPVQGRPILDWIIGALPPQVDKLIVVVNYLSDQIENYLRRQSHVENWVTVRQTEPRGTGDALLSCARHVTSDRLLVLNGDDLMGRADLAQLAEKPSGMLAHPVDDPSSFGILFPRPDGTLEKLVEKPEGLTPPQLANIGAYLFPRSVFNMDLQLSPRGEYEITDAVMHVANSQPFHLVPANFWFPIGTVDAWCRSQLADVSPAR